MTSRSPLYHSTSKEKPQLLHITFESDPKGSLGCQLVNTDKGSDDHMFLPGYAVIGKLLKGETVARKFDVRVGDVIVAVNGTGYRRFAPDYKEADVEYLNKDEEKVDVTLDNAVVAAGEAYNQLLSKIKAIKAAAPDPPLILTLERYGWDARSNSWPRYLAARDNNVPDAMMMQQQHEQWKSEIFPIDLTKAGLQEIFKQKAICEINIHEIKDFPPTVYINYGKLQQMEKAGEITADEVVEAFIIFTERLLAHSNDPRNPKTCQFIDLSGVSITGGFRVETLKRIYKIFEPNYPETLFKMVMFPVSSMVGLTARSLLSFVNEKTQSKFLITNSLDKVCEELGWEKRDVDDCGGIKEFMEKHEKVGDSFLF
ncbi:SEC14-like 1 (Saccharomyces cerevisiae) [Seminavis robusta]|uniref:SEC14-like 1 (Saccharomyces cerevisiae) n=1 Tax=Seminavis robusta TaxID=568900 RepID=A0A9N8HXD9_9STRA|nr:SEC14-like 1 (Saccharomyces cerevisiae) [Seminavis robusta]|eukprot:Sro2463_g328410.1 SEC14-like 1 (Saccharomyces cerevisiae) (370) ;mRNA; f:5133-6519